ncbi:MAG: xanthine dehydrogenase family protein subunit M [Acidobacteriota bacterium]
MKNFEYLTPKTIGEALNYLEMHGDKAKIIAGGVDLISLLKEWIEDPEILINIKGIKELKFVREDENFLRIGSLVTLSEITQNEIIKKNYGILVESCLKAASPQVRNQGTIGGNLCQRPRCWYFRGNFNCLRKDGTICYAVQGDNRYHAIFSPGGCYYVHPSDPAVALIALDAKVKIMNKKEEKIIDLERFFVNTDKDVKKETILDRNDILSEILIPKKKKKIEERFFKVSDRAVWSFAIVNLAGIFEVQKGVCNFSRIAIGGVAPVPLRASRVEESIKDKKLNEKIIKIASDVAVQGATSMEMNDYKLDLVKNLIDKTLSSLTGN